MLHHCFCHTVSHVCFLMTFNFLSICSLFWSRNMENIYKEPKGINCNLYLFCPLVFIDCTKACPGLITFRLTQSDWRFVLACRQHLSSLNSHLISQLQWLMRHSWMFYSIYNSCPRRPVLFVWYEYLFKLSSSWHVILTKALLVSELINKQKSGRVKVICIGISLSEGWSSSQSAGGFISPSVIRAPSITGITANLFPCRAFARRVAID